MADYIDKNILCEAYVHVELPEGITPDQLIEIEKHLLQFATSRAKFFIYPDVEVEVEFREGSLKAYIKIAGVIAVALGAYAGLRDGIDYLFTDVKRLADTMVAESLFTTKARHDNIRRTEARTGIVGSLKLLIDDLNTLHESIGQISVDETTRRLKRLQEDAERLLANVRSDTDTALIEAELDKFADSLPDRCPHPPEKPPENAAVLSYYDVLSEFRKSFGKRKQKQHTRSV